MYGRSRSQAPRDPNHKYIFPILLFTKNIKQRNPWGLYIFFSPKPLLLMFQTECAINLILMRLKRLLQKEKHPLLAETRAKQKAPTGGSICSAFLPPWVEFSLCNYHFNHSALRMLRGVGLGGWGGEQLAKSSMEC